MVVQERPRSLTHRVLRFLLTVWVVAYPVISCGPFLLGAAMGGRTGGYTALSGLLLGGLFWGPWLVGILVLGLLVLLTR